MKRELKDAIVGALVGEDRVEPLRRRKRESDPAAPPADSPEDAAIFDFATWALSLSVEDKQTLLPILAQLRAAEVQPSPIVVPE